jgi:eukaryotic-like serine/threonine-protein kinase
MVERPMAKSSPHPHAAGSAAKTDLLDGRYRLSRLLGEGGMGAVYLAEHVILGRQVAIKFLLADHASKADMIGRFHREARAAAAIHHRNIIEVFDVGVSAQGDPFLVMEYLEGESLAALLKRAGPLNLSETCAILEQALLGLQAAHRKGILHRDLKPDNLFLAYLPSEPPVVKLIDFGISKFIQGDPDKLRTKTGSLLGTPAYMSPEQARGLASLDHRSDLFSMGTILYEMLTGGLPFAGEMLAELLANLLTEPPKSPRQVRADFPIQAEPLVVKALAKDPALRFQTADEMLEALRELDGFDQRLDRLTLLASSIQVRGFAAGDLGQVCPPEDSVGDANADRSRWDEAPPPVRARRRIVLGIGGVATVLVGVAAAGIWVMGRGHRAPPVAPPADQARPLVRMSAPVPAPQAPSQAPVRPAEPAKDRADQPAVGAPALGERAGKTGAAAPQSKARPRPVRPAGSTATIAPPSARAPAGKGEGVGLRNGSRNTKMSESFE